MTRVTLSICLILSLLPATASAGGSAAEALEGAWVGCLVTSDADTAGAVALVLESESQRRATGPLALGIPGFEGIEFGDLDLTISGSGRVNGVAHSSLIAFDGVEVQAQLVINGDYDEEAGSILADATLHLAGMGGESFGESDYQKYFSGYDMGRFYGQDSGTFFGGHDLGEYVVGGPIGGSIGGALDRDGFVSLFDILDLGQSFGGHDLGEYIISTSVGGYFGGHDLGEYFGGHDMGEYFGGHDMGEYFGGHDMGEYFGGHDMGEYFEPELFGGHDVGEYFGGHDLGEYVAGSFVKRFALATPPTVQLSEGGAVSFVLMLVPTEG